MATFHVFKFQNVILLVALLLMKIIDACIHLYDS